ncbi:MAG: hypothetical protein ABI183_19610, partial [Polyangiaceae bacterium]
MHETPFSLLALAGCCALLATSAQATADDECRGVRVNTAANLSEPWATAARDLSAQIPANSDDRCAAMTLLVEPAKDDTAKLSVTAQDGRHADRIVLKPSALGSTALGLLASLPPDEPAPRSIAAPTDDAGAPQSPAAPAPSSSNAIAPTSPTRGVATAPPLAPEVWLGGGLGGRVAEPSAVGMLDLEARGDLEVKRWLLVISFRYGSSIGEQLTPNDASYEETVIGL